MLDICDLENGWHYIDGRCLKHFSDHHTWQQARQICRSHQGDLTIFKNYDQLLALNDLLTCRLYNYTAWIGLSDTVSTRVLINPFLHIYSFNDIDERSFRKALWKKVKLLKMSNFTFSHNIFYIICILKFFTSHILVVICSFFEFGTV